MNGYTKLFGRILDSTIWQEDLATKVLWVTMLVMVDRDGFVLASIPGLAKRANISLPECEASLAKLQAPDPYSQSKVEDGRRIKVVDGGWFLINYEYYRHQLSSEEQREKDRLRKAQYRLSQKTGTERDNMGQVGLSHDVPLCPQKSDIAAVAVSVTESATEKEKSKARALRATFIPPSVEEVRAYCQERKNQVDPEKWHNYYCAIGWYAGRAKMRDWKAAVRRWEDNNYGGSFQGGYQRPKQTTAERNQQAIIDARNEAVRRLEMDYGPAELDSSLEGTGGDD